MHARILCRIIPWPIARSPIRQEISHAEDIYSSDAKSLDYHKLASLPLLQSIYTEALRMHIGIPITRINTELVTIVG